MKLRRGTFAASLALGCLLAGGGIGSAISWSPPNPRPSLGTEKGETLNGTERSDDLRGRRGADRIHGREGREWLYGGRGGDVPWGGRGSDLIVGGRGNDTIWAIHGTKDRVSAAVQATTW